MGMFDYITCEMPLPRLESKEGEKVVVHIPYKADHQYQTKDLDNALVEYKIGKDRVFYEKKVEYEKRELTEEEKKDKESGGFWHPMWSLKPISEEWVKYEYTGYIDFYDFIQNIDPEHDAWVEYTVHIKDGKVEGEVQLVEFKEESNKQRKEQSARIDAEMKARKEYQQKWRYRFFGQYWNRLVNLVFRGVRWLGNKLNNSWKLEGKLKF